MTATKKQTVSRTLQFYKTYSFKDKDPVIDAARTAIAEAGENYAHLSTMTNVSASTLYNWFNGATRKPQVATIAAIGSALGYSAYDWEKKRFVGGRPKIRLAVNNTKGVKQPTVKKGSLTVNPKLFTK